MQKPDPTGLTVLITGGEFAGEEGVCLGQVAGVAGLWSVSAHSSNRIVNLRFDEDFGVLLNPERQPGKN
ncbi:MAG TPA: hypothetical protein VG838_08575 [Opitutaceae bacterium]|nr:hypothetical protein [Opitutaceae bacterium]